MPNSSKSDASISGKTVIITGANSGIGCAAARVLASQGARVVLACRSLHRATAAANVIRRLYPLAEVEAAELDLADLASVRRFSDAELARGRPLDVLINNAGVMTPPRRLETRDGFELQFGTNVVGHFALTARMMPALQKAPEPARVVTVASIAHKRGWIDFDDLQAQKAYSSMKAYAQSKLANLMLSFELDRRFRAAGSSMAAIAVHPGVAATNLFRAGHYPAIEKPVRDLVTLAFGLVLNSSDAGALPTLYAATSPDAQSGGYYGPQGLFEMRGKTVGPADVAPQARDKAVAGRLWQVCEDLTGGSHP